MVCRVWEISQQLRANSVILKMLPERITRGADLQFWDPPRQDTPLVRFESSQDSGMGEMNVI